MCSSFSTSKLHQRPTMSLLRKIPQGYYFKQLFQTQKNINRKEHKGFTQRVHFLLNSYHLPLAFLAKKLCAFAVKKHLGQCQLQVRPPFCKIPQGQYSKSKSPSLFAIRAISVTFLLIFALQVVSAQPVEKHGALRVEGAHMVDRSGQKVTLKGVSLGWHNWWPQYYNPAVVEYLSQSWHISVIRVAMGVEPAGGYLENPAKAEALIQTVIDAAIANGIYVIIDWHSHAIHTAEAEAFFSRMAQHYAGHPHIIYEIYNEPEHKPWQEIKAYSIRMIEAIRRYDDRNLIIVGTPNWSQDVDIVADDPIEGYDNILYALHFYAATHKADIRKKAAYAIGRGLPLFVSECSLANALGDGELDKKEFARWMKLLKANDISFVLWGLYDKAESSAMLKPDAPVDGNWPVSRLTEMGFYSRRIVGGGTGIAGIVSVIGIAFIAGVVFVLIRKRKIEEDE